MINKIIDGICEKLYITFGDGFEIYTELKNQDLKEPCFSVFCVNPLSTQVLGNRYFRNNIFCIQYFPSTAEPKAECNAITETLYTELETITIKEEIADEIIKESFVRSNKMRSEMIDGVLNFFVNYNLFVYRTENTEVMEEMTESNIDAKG